MASEEDAEKRNLFIVIGSMIGVLVLLGLLSLIQVPYTGYVTYTDREPYTNQECNNISLKSIIEWGNSPSVCLNQICDSQESLCAEKNFWGNCIRYYDSCRHYACTKYKITCNLNIENIDDTAGTWSISGYKYDYNLKKTGDFVKDVSVFIQPTKVGIATWDYIYDAGENVGCSYTIKYGPIKSVCRDLIDYRDVEKTKTEVKYCSALKKLGGIC